MPPLSPTPTPPKKKRSLAGMPDPNAEVIALSPKTLLTTNRFICEICNKGFQREQNLQLHRRGHNMPWKLRQRASEEIRKKVYVCPEPSCVHHNPSRALGDLTGVKKHFSRKHGEKKWKCERCSKNYAVKSDCKAHMKSCGNREYKCDCGSFFSRRDSFVTHKAFCEVLAEKSAKEGSNVVGSSAPPTPPLTPSTISVASPPTLSSVHNSDIAENPTKLSPPSSNASTSTSCCSSFSSLMTSLAHSDCPTTSFSVTEPTTLSLFTPLYLSNNNNNNNDQYPLPHYSPALSATALLQKAAQMGSRSSNSSLLHALGLKENSVSISSTTSDKWNVHGNVKQENELVTDYLGLGLLPCGNEIMGSSDQPMTRDLLGLSMGLGRDDDLSALLTSFGGNFDSSA
ncbi:zinc finger protein GAI-ASSOCIATED FACTOR 1-like isoform X1 [Trifolium pratense]|uniref:zinc finger protein GAI-ASSOCIATED FACTOR 1-like isoform X1 n=1 Tax=Trifolium pratense TaxID=57577 RepID=UPI001E69729F|nr:zinc finger protein GAI-ASSOCIATED FACTOR 1-like isoform X1 [Trifolium pratense]